MAGPATTANYAPLGVFVERTTLEVALPILTISKFGKKYTLPQKNSKTLKVRRYERLAPTSGAQAGTIKSMAEGVVPGAVNPTITDYTVTVAQYGNLSQISDQASWTNFEDVDRDVIKRNAENMVQTLERVYWAGVIGGTQVQRLTDDVGGIAGAARVNVAGRINAQALDKAIRTLQSADAKPIYGAIKPGKDFATQGIRPGYVGVIHPFVKYDLERVPGYVPVTAYGSMDGVLEGEVGSYKEIRFVTSTLAQIFPDAGAAVSGTYSTTGTNNDVFINMFFGQNAYAVVELASSSQSFYIPASNTDHSNPLGQWSSIGWKAMAASLILNDAWLVRQECAASA